MSEDAVMIRRYPHQNAAISLSCIVGIVTALLGIALLASPYAMIEAFLSCQSNDGMDGKMIETLTLTLARLSGGCLVALSASSLSLLAPALLQKVPTIYNHDKCRSSLFSQSITGVTMVVVGLLDERTGDSSGSCSQFKAAWILGFGAVIIVLACGGLMFSFWPSVEQTDDVTPQESRICCGFNNRRERVAAENTVPLLSSTGNDEEANYEVLGEAPDVTTEGDTAVAEEEIENLHNTATSRITGTRRLIKLAAPQMLYLYIGCAVLLVRLPFSLSIPHFVSTTLGALGRGDFAAARVEVLLLFILGTIDAALDFWCVFLFGYAKERIVRGVRIDTFRSILKQDISFFDSHTSGDLSSRLNSDCGEMAGGKYNRRQQTSGIRFSNKALTFACFLVYMKSQT